MNNAMELSVSEDILLINLMRKREVASKRNSKNKFKNVDIKLKQWARGFLTHDRREIVKATGGSASGSLGQQVKRNNKPNNIYADEPYIEIDDAEYRRLNTVMLAMTPYNYMFLNRHYIARREFIEDHISKGVTPKRAADLFLRKMQLTKNMYSLDLRESQDEFLLRGGF